MKSVHGHCLQIRCRHQTCCVSSRYVHQHVFLGNNAAIQLCRMRLGKVADRRAWFRRKPAAGLVHHSDRGSQYARDKLKEYGMACSMSRKDNCWITRQRKAGSAMIRRRSSQSSCNGLRMKNSSDTPTGCRPRAISSIISGARRASLNL